MKIKKFKQFINEDYTEASEDAGLYDKMSILLNKANILYCKFKGDDPDDWEDYDSPEEAMEALDEIPESHELYTEALELYNEIYSLNEKIDETESESYFNNKNKIE